MKIYSVKMCRQLLHKVFLKLDSLDRRLSILKNLNANKFILSHCTYESVRSMLKNINIEVY